ncbi:nucleotidyltransferase domain-containing protein [uncultured Sphingomonas sp.]|uniref:nucleotidyltransferase domain-containing protein n=1 Tax=uncultured Sphingomonas sp. TaxID=158754 RepID=UPI0035CB2EC5
MSTIDLSPMQRDVLRDVLTHHASDFRSAAVYGSRAQDRARPGSDVDLAFYGVTSPDLIGRIDLDLMDSDLSIFWNLTVYDEIRDPAFKRQVDRWAVPFFTAADAPA